LDAGNEVSFAGITAEVVRKQADGTWKYIIDDPWGGAEQYSNVLSVHR